MRGLENDAKSVARRESTSTECMAPGFDQGPWHTGEEPDGFFCELGAGHEEPFHAWGPLGDWVTWPMGEEKDDTEAAIV